MPAHTAESTAGWATYAAGARRRSRAAARRNAAWNALAAEQALAASRVLKSEFGAREVILFGSVARNAGRPGSDVDLLVAGVAPDQWFAACAAAADLVTCGDVDLVPRERAHVHVLTRALGEGRTLDG
jgi:predicted nucleotidyltransferase